MNDEKDCEKKQKEYYETIDRCAKEEIDLTIYNSDPKHASYLLKTLFSRAKSEVCIYTGGLSETVFADQPLINKAVEFLKDNVSHKIQIAFQEKDSKDKIFGNVFVKAIISEGPLKDRLELWQASEYFSDVTNHFTVMDRKAFRYETDHEKKTAVANFGDKESAKSLFDMFEIIISKSTRLPVPACC